MQKVTEITKHQFLKRSIFCRLVFHKVSGEPNNYPEYLPIIIMEAKETRYSLNDFLSKAMKLIV